MGTDRKTELGVETGVEASQWFGVGLIEPVLEAFPGYGGSPETVHVVVDETQLRYVFVNYRPNGHGWVHTLQAIRNLSVSSTGVRSQ